MRAVLIAFVLTAVAVVVQLTIVDRIAFPGGAGPDLVLLVVVALALARGPLAGALTGFWAGLALDVAPPGSHFTGQDALVFCLVGYACGLLADSASADSGEPGHTALFEILVMAVAVVCGEALLALLGVTLSDPRVTWSAIRHVLPAAAVYDVLLCSFVLYAVAAALRLAGARAEGRRPGWSASQARAALAGPNQGAIRQLADGNSPRLRLSERDRSQRPAVGLRGPGVPRREPQLKFGRTGPRPAAAAFAAGGLAAGTPKIKFGSTTMGRSLLGGSVFSRSSSQLGTTSRFGRSAPLGRSSPFRHRGNALRGAGGGLAGPVPRFSRGRSLTGVLRRSATPKSPGRGWLRGASARGGSARGGGALPGGISLGGRFPRGSSLRGASPRGKTPRGKSWRRSSLGRGSLGGRPARTRLRMPRPKVKRRRRTGGYR